MRAENRGHSSPEFEVKEKARQIAVSNLLRDRSNKYLKRGNNDEKIKIKGTSERES